MAQKPAKGSVAQTVRTYIERRPVVRDAMDMGIVNLSALTRQIMQDTGLGQEEAVLVACRRYTPRQTLGLQDGIRRLLRESKLEVRSRVAVLTLRAGWRVVGRLEGILKAAQGRGEPVHVLHGSESVTVILDETMLDEAQEAVGPDEVLKQRRGLVELNLRTPAVVADTPGLLAFLASSLATHGINFVEVISCHKDNMFVIEEADMFAAFEVLNGLIRG